MSDRNDLAEERTDLAEDRTILANERTYAGWMRTGFAAVGIGLGFQALFREMEPVWIPKAIATAFLLIAIFVLVIAERRACAVLARLHPHEIRTMKTINLRVMTYGAVAATLVLIGALWLLQVGEG